VSGVIRKFIETTTPYNICAEESGGGEAIKKAREFGCDLVVLDLSMPGLNGAETASVLRRMLPRANIVRLTMFAREFKRGLFDASGFDLVLF
jgi:DNA-binding NarL/FixJ family response regulator